MKYASKSTGAAASGRSSTTSAAIGCTRLMSEEAPNSCDEDKASNSKLQASGKLQAPSFKLVASALIGRILALPPGPAPSARQPSAGRGLGRGAQTHWQMRAR